MKSMVKRGRFMTIVEPAGVVCRTCDRGPYRSRLACFPHALRCKLNIMDTPLVIEGIAMSWLTVIDIMICSTIGGVAIGLSVGFGNWPLLVAVVAGDLYLAGWVAVVTSDRDRKRARR